MEIVLGLFNREGFYYLRDTYKFIAYPFTELVPDSEIEDNHYFLLDIVRLACERCTKIHFNTTGIRLPFNSDCITCNELSIILDNKKLLRKTQFWKGRSKIDKRKFLNKIHAKEN